MALETLRGFDCGDFITVNHDTNEITFRIQNGPIAENGLNGCQVDNLIIIARQIITKLNERFKCRENDLAVTKLQEAEMWLRERKRERTARGVEGHDKA